MISTVQNQSQQHTIRTSPRAQRPADLASHERVSDGLVSIDQHAMQSTPRMSTDVVKTKMEHGTGMRSPYMKHEAALPSPVLRTQNQSMSGSIKGSPKSNVHEFQVTRCSEMEGRRPNHYNMTDMASPVAIPRAQCWPPYAGVYGPNKFGRSNAELSQYKRQSDAGVGGVQIGTPTQTNGKHLPPRFSDYSPVNRADQASDTNRILSAVRTRAVRTTQDELENLRVLCQKLEHQLQQQLTQISSLEKVEKKTAELGAQWNFFHHAQMQKQAIMYREHYEKRESDLKAIQADLQDRLTLVSRENASLKGKLGQTSAINSNQAPNKDEIPAPARQGQAHEAKIGNATGQSKLKRKSMSLTSVEPLKLECLDGRNESHETKSKTPPRGPVHDVQSAEKSREESRRDLPVVLQPTARIPTRTSSAPELLQSSDDARESPCKKPRLSSLPSVPSTMAVPVPLTAPLHLVDGILPPPIKIVLDNEERYIDPKIAEIKQDLTAEDKEKKLIPPIVTSP